MKKFNESSAQGQQLKVQLSKYVQSLFFDVQVFIPYTLYNYLNKEKIFSTKLLTVQKAKNKGK